MIQKSQFKTATRVVQLSNTVTWIRNYKNQFMDLTSTQSDAIIYILKNYQDNSLTANELMRDLQLSQSTVAGIISRLEAKGLICRRPAENDNRKNIIYPTAKGMVLEEDLKKKAVELEAILLQGMSDREQEEFNRLLQIALDNANIEREKQN